jgi:hypothetical protein
MDDRPMLDRNLEALVRRSALPLREEELPRARRAFLRRLSEPAAEPRPRAGAWAALAASLLVCAAIFSAILAERRDGRPLDVSLPPAAAPPLQDTRVVPTTPPGQDGAVTLLCTLAAPKTGLPLLRIGGTAELPDRLVLTLTVHRSVEQGLGGRLAPAPLRAAGGLVELRRGRFEYSCAWEVPGPAVVTAEVSDDFQPDELKRRFGGRRWRFEFPGWTADLPGRVPPALRETDAFAPELRTLLGEIEAAVSTEAAWRAAEKPLLDRMDRLARRIDASEAKKLLPAATELLIYTLNFLKSSAPHFAWEAGKFKGPVTYYTGGEKLKDFRNADFGLDRLRSYLGEVGPLAGREAALWFLKELRRGGPRPALAAPIRDAAAHEGLAPFAPRLEAAAPEDFDALEAAIRAP